MTDWIDWITGTVVEEVDETLDCEDNANYGNPDAGPCNDGPQDSFGIKCTYSNFRLQQKKYVKLLGYRDYYC